MSNYDFWDELGRIFNAVVAYQEKTVEFNDRFITPWIKLGNVFDRQDRSKEAVSAYQNAIVIDPASAKNWYELGNIYFQMDDFENAADAYKKSADLAPDSGWTYNNLALTYVSQGKYEESIALYQKSIELLQVDTDRAVAWNRLGNVYRKLNNYDQAVRAFTEADKLDSENAGFRDELVDVPAAPGTSVAAENVSEDPSAQEVVDALQLDIAEQADSVDLEQLAEELASSGRIDSEELAIVAVELTSEQTLETVSEIAAESQTQEISESPAEDEAPQAESQLTLEIAPVEQLDSPVENQEAAAAVDQVQAEAEVEASLSEPNKSEQRSILEIVEAVIAKVFAESTTEEVEPAPAAIAEGMAESETDGSKAPVDEQADAQQPVVSEPESQVDPVDDPDRATGDLVLDIEHDEALQLAAQSSSETFTETIFATESVVNTADASLLIVETKIEVQTEVVVEEVSLELNVQEPDSDTETDESAPENRAYDEYLKDNSGHLKIQVNESENEKESVQDSMLPPELMAKIDFSGDIEIEADAKNAHVWNELGNVYFSSGTFEDAVVAYSKSIELDRQFAWPYSNLALVYVHKGRFAEAMLLYQRSIELFSNDKDKAISWNRLGNVYRRLNDYDNAIAAYQRADELDTDNTTLSLQSRFSLLGNYATERKPSYVS